MKISVGQVLIVVGVGTYAVLGPLNGMDKAAASLEAARNFAADHLPFMDGLRAQAKPPAAEEPAALPKVEDRLPAREEKAPSDKFSEKPLTPVPVDAAPVPPAPEEPVTTNPAPVKVPDVKEDAVKAEAAPRRRRRAAKVVAPVKPAPKAAKAVEPAAAAPKKGKAGKKAVDPMVGTYVALSLKTGNTVKGVLLEKTATNYKMELPGLGAFDYPAETVTSVKAAE